MIAGLPLVSWILIVASVGLGLALELRYYGRYRSSSARHQGDPSRTDLD